MRYGGAALAYWRAGYAPLPLLSAGKGVTPKGATGYAPATTEQQVVDWAVEYGDRGVCLRLEGLVGLDVDAYDGRPGAEALAALEAEHGSLPPTVRVSSRVGAPDYDGTSGIRLYRLPPALLALERKAVWRTGPGEGIETVRLAHRQANVWPTRHPKTGREYAYLDERTGEVVHGVLPPAADLPLLLEAWAPALLKAGASADDPDAVSAERLQVPEGWLTEGEPCRAVSTALDAAVLGLQRAGRHDLILPAQVRLLRLGEQGHHGAGTALRKLQDAFTAAVADARDGGAAEAESEWERALQGAAGSISRDGLTPEPDRHCCREQVAAADEFEALPDEPGAPDKRTPWADGGAFLFDQPDHVPTVWGSTDEVLWAEGEALMLAGPPGVGKTTITGQLVAALLFGGEVLGWPVTRAEGAVLYLAMDRPRQIARALRRHFTPDQRASLDERLRVWQGPPPGDMAKDTDQLLRLARSAGASHVVVDSLKDAAVALTEETGAAGYNRARQTALAGGVQVLELHHMVKRGANGKAPTTLADLYGGMPITAGAGSVLLLWGEAGQRHVTLRHLKPILEPVEQAALEHDHAAGRTRRVGGGGPGPVAKAVAWLDAQGLDPGTGLDKTWAYVKEQGGEHSRDAVREAVKLRRDRATEFDLEGESK